VTSPRRLAIAVALVALLLALSIATLVGPGDGPRDATVPPSVGAPPDPLIGTPRRSSPAADAVPAGADAAARRFLRGYLALLYGRGTVRDVTDASRPVRRALRANVPRVPPGQRQRRPRVVDLRLIRQAPAAVLATASVDDGDLAVYPIVFALDRRDGRWVVARLSDD
jgi:hypothetical protein